MLNSIINVDLHIHSKKSEYKEPLVTLENGEVINIVEDSTKDNLEVLLKNLNSKNINLFSFTDHNRFDGELYKEAKKEISIPGKWPNIKGILPGVEFDVKIEEGKDTCHIITIFDAETEIQIDNIEARISERVLGKEEFYCLSDFENLIRNIGLNTIFIACQRKSLNNPEGGKNSVSNSVNDVYEFLKYGFISCLEYQKNSVQGMLINDLKDFPRSVGLICGSDCHQWSVYPKHDITDNNTEKKYFFSIKALPTFLGLLAAFTSPETRFKQKQVESRGLKQFSINNSIIELSPGINAIIGENGTGKTTLINALAQKKKLESHQKEIIEKNKVVIPEIKESREIVYQNDIIKKNEGNTIFNESLFSQIDNTEFTTTIDNYAKKLKEYINFNINKKEIGSKLIDLKLKIDPDLYNAKTFYIQIKDNLKCENNVHKDRVKNLTAIIKSLKNEIKEGGYTQSEKDLLIESFDKICIVRNHAIRNYKNAYLDNSIKNIIKEKIKSYGTNLTKLSVDVDNLTIEYKKEFNKVTTQFIEYYKSYVCEKKIFPKIELSNIAGFSENKSRGFNFIKKSKYYQKDDIEKELLGKLFNSQYQSVEKIKSIDTKELFSTAVSSGNIENYIQKFDSAVEKFKAEQMESVYEVLDATSTRMGNTLGEKSLVYYRYMTTEDNDFDVLFIDQPEDNISNNKIQSKLIDYLNSLRDKKQIIIVTHNPLLVVNLDVDNVIVLNQSRDNLLDISYGCLEMKESLKAVSKIMDGGKEMIERRLKLYNAQENTKN